MNKKVPILKGEPKKNHMNKVADKLVETHKKNEKLKEKKVNTSFLKLF